ncbi:MAG: LysR family transcriptional regulator, partial [Rhodocyclaceae bacterium]|nr:LysR family transcriptional regulator [Rhodocyclaceae bacterium]
MGTTVPNSIRAVYSYVSYQHYVFREQYTTMNPKHLYYFWKVAKHGGVLRAGEAIHISPQTLSGQIKLLEEQFGTALFKRKGRSLELTEAGKLAFEYADEMFVLGAELDQVIRHFPT